MDKFISAFNRSQPKKDDEGRSHQFVKRLATPASPFINDKILGQTLSLSELSSIEKDVYSAWWNELDPFGLGIVVDETMLPFLQASGLAQETLQKIIDLYAGESRYTEDQFYAILRLVAHGQSGRKINRDLVALGAPLTNFDQEVIDSLFRQGKNGNSSRSTSIPTTGKDCTRNTWWGQQLSSQKNTLGSTLFPATEPDNHQQQHQLLDLPATTSHRHSYAAGSSLSQSHIPAFNVNGNSGQPSSWTSSATTPLPSHQTKPFDWAEQALSTSTKENGQQQPSVGAPSTTIATNSKNIYSHSRSRSVPFASQDMPPTNASPFDTITATQSKHDPLRPPLTSSRSSMDTTDFFRLQQQQQRSSIDHGQHLLLTQKFVPPVSTTKSTNPFENDDDDNDDNGDKMEDDTMATVDQHTQIPTQHPQDTTRCPFDDVTEESLTTTKTVDSTCITINGSIPSSQSNVTRTLTDLGNIAFKTPSVTSLDPTTITTNQRSNRNHIPAPTIPPQSTKPGFLQHTPNQPLKRSQSHHTGQKHSFMSQGAFLLATSSTSSSVQFPVASPTTTMPSDDTSRLFRHRSTTSFPRK